MYADLGQSRDVACSKHALVLFWLLANVTAIRLFLNFFVCNNITKTFLTDFHGNFRICQKCRTWYPEQLFVKWCRGGGEENVCLLATLWNNG